MGLLGAYALAATFAFGAAAFGLPLAAECAVVGIVEEALCTGLLFNLLLHHFASATRSHPASSVASQRIATRRPAEEPEYEAAPPKEQMQASRAIRMQSEEAPRRAATAAVVRKAALLTAFVFALCHLAQPWKLPIAFVFSLGMVALYRCTGSLVWPMCAHAAFDLLWFGLVGLP